MVKKLLELIILKFQIIIKTLKHRLGIYQYFLVFYEGKVKEGWVKGDIHLISGFFSKLILIENVQKLWEEKGYKISDIFILGLYKFKNRLEYYSYTHGLGRNDIQEKKNKED
jgi:hypothetical protein